MCLQLESSFLRIERLEQALNVRRLQDHIEDARRRISILQDGLPAEGTKVSRCPSCELVPPPGVVCVSDSVVVSRTLWTIDSELTRASRVSDAMSVVNRNQLAPVAMFRLQRLSRRLEELVVPVVPTLPGPFRTMLLRRPTVGTRAQVPQQRSCCVPPQLLRHRIRHKHLTLATRFACAS